MWSFHDSDSATTLKLRPTALLDYPQLEEQRAAARLPGDGSGHVTLASEASKPRAGHGSCWRNPIASTGGLFTGGRGMAPPNLGYFDAALAGFLAALAFAWVAFLPLGKVTPSDLHVPIAPGV
jgi:hypothetical protein